MATRHFRRKVKETDEVPSSSDDELNDDSRRQSGAPPTVLTSADVEYPTQNYLENTEDPSGDNVGHDNTEEEAEDVKEVSDDNSNDEDSTRSSSEEEELVLQKPVYLKRTTSTRTEPDSNKRQKAVDSSVEDLRHTDLLKRIDLANEGAQRREELMSEMLGDYTTDKDLLRRTMLLDDDDNKDPDFERKEWERRNAERLKRQRDILVARQLELEEQQARKLKYSNSKDLEVGVSEEKEEKDTKKKMLSAINAREHGRIHPEKAFQPQKVQDVQFGDLSTTHGSNDDQRNEYSVL